MACLDGIGCWSHDDDALYDDRDEFVVFEHPVFETVGIRLLCVPSFCDDNDYSNADSQIYFCVFGNGCFACCRASIFFVVSFDLLNLGLELSGTQPAKKAHPVLEGGAVSPDSQ